MKITTVGLDLAKNVFSVHGVDERGTVVLRKTVRRAKLMELFAQLPVCVVGMEACRERSTGRASCASWGMIHASWRRSLWRRIGKAARTMRMMRRPSVKR